MVAIPAPVQAAGGGINICVGGYSGSVAGLSLQPEGDGLLSLTATFATDAHQGAVRSAALLGPTLVTGSADETIRVYDLARRVERGTLFQHNGTVNALRFARDGQRDLLLSAGEDAAVCVWRVSDWHCLKRLTGHQAPVLDVAVHPSARVALTVAKDRSLFMWNLLKGKVAYSAKTKGVPAGGVEWAPGGEKYLLRAGKVVTVSRVEGRAITTFPHEKDVHASVFLSPDTFATGGEEKIVSVWDARTPGKSVVACRHGTRVRGLASVDSLLLSADSTGGLKVWDVRMEGTPRLETSVGGGDMRLTCLAGSSEERYRGITLADEDIQREEHGERIVAKDRSKKAKLKSRRKNKDGDEQRERSEDAPDLEGTASQRKRKKRKKQ